MATSTGSVRYYTLCNFIWICLFKNYKYSFLLPPSLFFPGHPKIKAFVTHGGLLSMFETVYHGVPIVSIPIFCDHDSNAAKAEVDGYAKKLELQYLTADKLFSAITEVINDPKYKDQVRKRRVFLRDQKESPLERAIYWTEYVIRHKGAYHLQSPAKDLNFIQYYSLDILFAFITFIISLSLLISYTLRFSFKKFVNYIQSKHVHQLMDRSRHLTKPNKLIDKSTLMKKKL